VPPPDYVISHSLSVAALSTCQKSQRGVSIYERATSKIWGAGCNRPPRTRQCDGSRDCRLSCAKRCLHAEDNAIGTLGVLEELLGHRKWKDFDLVHVKSVDGKLVAGGGPSCWQCSRRILELDLGNVWLYETAFNSEPIWRCYPADEFDRLTRIACAVY
jgi:deoxycytidylate deaminase